MDVDIAISLARSSLRYSKLKPKQLEAVKAFVLGNDVFVSLLTGYGKSLIYGISPSVFKLIEGMHDGAYVTEIEANYYLFVPCR